MNLKRKTIKINNNHMSKGARSDVKSSSEVEILSSLNSISTATYSSDGGFTNKAF